MTSAGGDPGGALVVRVWREDDSDEHFRARVTLGSGEGLEPRTVVATSPDEVLEIVRAWLLLSTTADSSRS